MAGGKLNPAKYFGDERALKLKQMASRAVAEGLMSPDRIESVCPHCLRNDLDDATVDHSTVRELMKMPVAQRRETLARALNLERKEDFEVFEADEFYELEEIHG